MLMQAFFPRNHCITFVKHQFSTRLASQLAHVITKLASIEKQISPALCEMPLHGSFPLCFRFA